ncbi:Hypothetical Protein FCC1311_000402 [Hondaea fermentalgiana]|uniref:Uncharacterized protein n=1 Tax=Hondaea fermentalgiana TaxID=2315210 RepID=A0A2R5FYL4_9STRA|nr:Hypothetical Protein FCC1311_000402 [Hondaea fermentalgiana]|eukprot:GBG23820.1 Hypothetical Protein FCC1311_000402 [Hondaea fermentalgiana]
MAWGTKPRAVLPAWVGCASGTVEWPWMVEMLPILLWYNTAASFCCILLPGPEGDEEEHIIRTDWDKNQVLAYAADRAAIAGIERDVMRVHIERRLKLILFRRQEALEYWRDIRNAPTCLVIMRTCRPVIGFAHLVNQGIGFVSETDQGNPRDLQPGQRCFVVSQWVIHDEIFRAAQPRTLVLDKDLDIDIDLSVVQQVLPPDGKLVMLGNADKECHDALKEHKFCILAASKPCVAVPARDALPCPSLHAPPRLVQTLVINMEQDKLTRWPRVLRELKDTGLDKVWPKPERYRAIDGGRDIVFTKERQHLFRVDDIVNSGNPYEDHGFRAGVLGCAASHIAIWAALARRSDLSDLDAILVLEDDAQFPADAVQRWHGSAGSPPVWQDPRWDIFMLGFATDPDFHPANRIWDGPVDWLLMEAWGPRRVIVAYKAVPRVILDRREDLQDSRTVASYPLSRVSNCLHKPITGETALHPAINYLRIVIDDKKPESRQNVHPDVGLVPILVLATGQEIQTFEDEHQCARVCVHVFPSGTSNLSHPLQWQCVFLFGEMASPIYIDPASTMPGRASEIIASVVSESGVIWSNAVVGPIPIFVIPEAIQLQSRWTSKDKLEVTIVVSHAPSDFTSKHSTALICCSDHCAPLVALPWSFRLARSSPHAHSISADFHALGDDRELARPIQIKIPAGTEPTSISVSLALYEPPPSA